MITRSILAYRLPIALCVISSIVISCGGRKPELIDPGLGLVEMVALAEQSHIEMTIRLENRSELPLVVDQMTLTMSINDIPLDIRLERTPSRIATLSSELIPVKVDFSVALIEALDQLTTGQSRRLSMTMTGNLSTDSGKQLTIDETSWINATPGKPGYFR